MALSDFSKRLMQLTQAAADTVKDVAEDVAKNVKIPSADEVMEGAKEFSQSAAETAKNLAGDAIDAVSDAVDSAKDAVSDAVESLTGEGEEAPQEQDDAPQLKAIPVRSAMKVIYCLMAADGEIFHNEEEKFDAIGKELSATFDDEREAIIEECKAAFDKVIDPEDYLDVLCDEIRDALSAPASESDTCIAPKLLVWDLLTIAYSDEHYDTAERKLLKYVVRRTNVDKAVFLEMESSILTLSDIEAELSWIKTTDRPYLTIEAQVNELEGRKNTILESVKDLITL